MRRKRTRKGADQRCGRCQMQVYDAKKRTRCASPQSSRGETEKRSDCNMRLRRQHQEKSVGGTCSGLSFTGVGERRGEGRGIEKSSARASAAHRGRMETYMKDQLRREHERRKIKNVGSQRSLKEERSIIHTYRLSKKGE